MKINSKPWEIILATILVSIIVYPFIPHHYDISKDTEHKDEIGKRYITRQELYLYKYKGVFGPVVLKVPGWQSISLDEVIGESMPFNDEGDYILKIIPKNTVFEIVGIKKVVRIPRSDTSTIARFLDDAIYPGEFRVDTVIGQGYLKHVDEIKSEKGNK